MRFIIKTSYSFQKQLLNSLENIIMKEPEMDKEIQE